MALTSPMRMGSLLLSNSARTKTLPAFHSIRSYSKLKKPGESSFFFKGHAPAIVVGGFVLVSHFIWRAFQDTDFMEGKGAEFPHSKFPALVRHLYRKARGLPAEDPVPEE